MSRAIISLVLAVVAEAVIDFPTSQFITEEDLRYDSEGVQVTCPGTGCTLYTTYMAGQWVGLYDGDKLIAMLNDIYNRDNGFLSAYKMKASNSYRLKKTVTGEMVVNVKILIVADSAAGSGAVTDFPYASSEFVLRPPAWTQVVTVLNTLSEGLTFSDYKGAVAPKIYAAGFDMVGTCKPLYTFRRQRLKIKNRHSFRPNND